MKLHLPKALLAAVIAAFAGLSQHAMGEILTVDLLKSTADWTHKNGSAPESISINGGGSNYMIYEFDRQLSATAGQNLSFTLTLNIAASGWSGVYDALTGVAFIGSETAVVMGSLDYNSSSSFGYATSTNTDVNFYNLTGNTYDYKPAANVSSTYQSLVDPHPLGQDITVTGTIAKNPADSGSGYTMTLNYGDTSYTVDMGEVVNMERVVFYADGPIPATIKALTMTGYTGDLVEITWAGTSKNNTWSSTSFASGAATDDTSQITFAPLSEGISNTVVISGDVTARSVTINDNYTFQADGVAKLSPGKLTVAADKTLTYGGSGTLTIDSAINGNLNVTGGTLNLKGAEAITGSKLDIVGGTVFIDCNSGEANLSAINKDTAVSIGAGGKLHLKGHDSMGWGSKYDKTLASILLKGEDANNKAELVLEEVKKAEGTNWDGRNSIGYNIDLQGYSTVTGIGGNNIIQGASVTASGVGNSITFDFLQVSQEWNVTVENGGQLAIHATATGTAADRKATIVKKGAGELTLTGSYNSAVDVQGGTMVVGSTGRLAGAISIADGATFEIATNDAAHNGALLTRATGSGDIVLSSETRVSSGSTSVFSGTLTMRNEALLDLSDDTNGDVHKNDTYNLTSIKSVVLDNASIEYRGQSTSLKNVTVKGGGATLNVKDLSDISHKFTLSETTNLQGKLTINNGEWKSHVQIDKLTGTNTGELVVNMGNDGNDKMTIKSFDQYAGKVTLNKQKNNPVYNFGLSAADTLDFVAGSSVTNYSTLNIYGALTGSTSISGGTINLKNGASVGGSISFQSTVNLEGTLVNTGNLTLSGLNVNSIDNLVAIPSEGTNAEYSAGENGYLATSYYVIQNGEGGSLTANNLSGYTLAGSVLAAENGKFEQDSNGSLLLTLTGAGIYYVNTDVTLGGEAASPGVANATGFIINNGGHLKLNTALTSGMTSGISVADNANASISLTGGITLSHGNTVTTGEGAKVSYTVDGATLNIDTLANTNIETVNVTNSGTLYLKEATAKLGEEGKYVTINLSNKGKFAFDNGNGTGATIYANINVNGDGELIGSYFGNNSNILGDITGTDNSKLKLSQRAKSTNSWIISGDISGNMAVETNAHVTLRGNNTYSGGTTITGGTLTTASENALGTGTVKMQGGTLEMAAALSVTAMEYTNGAVNNGSHNLNVGTLTVAEGATMSLSGSGATTAAVVDLKSGASLSAAGELTMGNLTMADGSKLAASSTITLSGSDNRVLDLGSKLTLDGEWFNNLLAELTGSKTAALFAGVTELKLNGVAYANQVDLADHFLNVEQGKYYLVYADSVVYAGLGEVIPEPTTATLSLLALAGLCARRRRRA